MWKRVSDAHGMWVRNDEVERMRLHTQQPGGRAGRPAA
jgi:hypothetical protein